MWGDFIKLDIFYGSSVIGSGTIYNQNGEDFGHFSCPVEDGYIYKLFLRLDSDTVHPLGVMLKNGHIFTLQKKLVLHKLNGTITSAYVEKKPIGSTDWGPLPFPFSLFTKVSSADIFMGEPILQECVLAHSDVLSCTYEGVTYVAAPLLPDAPFSLSAFMCHVTPVTSLGKQYGVLALNKKNIPIFLNKNTDTRP